MRFLILILLTLLCCGRVERSKEKPERAKPLVRVSLVKRGYIAHILEYLGTVRGVKEAHIYTQVPGKLLRYTVREGESVKKDQVIALLDRSVPGLEYKPVQVKTPISGIVGILYLKPGELVTPQVPLALVSDISSLEVEVEIPQKDIPKIETSKTGYVLYQEREIPAKILSVSSSLDPLKKTAKARLRILKPGKGMRPGMLLKVRIATQESRNALIIPESSLIIRGKDTLAFVVEKGRAEERRIRIGISSYGRVEVLEGLKEGEYVVSLGAPGLTNNQEVEVER